MSTIIQADVGMLRSKVFLKKTKRGGILKIVREHYLRDDISCSVPECDSCDDSASAILQKTPLSISKLCRNPHYLMLDTNVVLHQIDILEDVHISNVIILQVVLEEVRHRSAPTYKRIKDLIGCREKHFYTFANEFHKDTYVERQPGEIVNDRNDRAIRTATAWYQQHLDACFKQPAADDDRLKVILLTNDLDNRSKATADGIIAHTVHDYVRSLEGCDDLVDRLANLDTIVHAVGRQAIYLEHLALSTIQAGLRSGRLLQGSFQASRENYLEANVSVQSSDQYVFIQGQVNMNRAVHDDIVAIEMLPESQWTCPSSMVLEDVDEKPDEDTTNEDLSVKTKPGGGRSPRLPTGRVVGIIKRNWRQYCGILQKSDITGATRHLFVPAERRIPKIRVETRQSDTLQGQRIIVVIDSWPKNSRYPLGHFARKLGEIGERDTENEVLLLEHDVPHAPFSPAVLACLPAPPWDITPKDFERRTDLRDLAICSVDPPGCTDIDDALHARVLPNGNYEVGVHIADVSHFIRPGTAIDLEACHRATTVYLIDKRIDMVPELLSSNLCSLRGNEERFAFTVIWEMTRDAKIVNTRFMKSVICSKAALTYAEAQMRIDDVKMDDDVTQGLRRLNSLAKVMKQRRVEQGALTLASSEVRFHIDSETHDPIDVQAKELRETNSMVEEFMLLANISVAEKILAEFPDCALLRRHPSPPPANFDPLIATAKSKGFILDVSSGKCLAASLELAVVPDNAYFNTMLRILATRCMMQAVYFCSGLVAKAEFHHYGLAAPIYTHFTSPIRRFSDIIVHRLLAVAIGADASYADLLDKKKTQHCSHNLNYRHKMAQYAGRASVALHSQLFFRKRIVDEQGYVLFVRKNALQILIPKFGLEGTVFLSGAKKEPSLFTYDEEENTQSAGGVVIRVFDPVTVQISIDSSNVQHQKLQLKLVTPKIAGFSVDKASTESSCPPPTKRTKNK